MKKILFMTSAALILSTGCDNNDGPTYDPDPPEIKTAATLSVPEQGGQVEIAYEILNPTSDGELTATSPDEWMHDFVGIDSTTTTFTADSNSTGETREGKILLAYTYGDGQSVSAEISVSQAAIKEDPPAPEPEYDYNFDLTDFTGYYYGPSGNNGEHRYSTYISDMPLIEGLPQSESTYYLMEIYAANAPDNENAPLPPAGTYTLSEPKSTADMTFSYDYSKASVMSPDGEYTSNIYFDEGTLTIEYDGSNIVMDAVLTDEEGMTHHFTYSGEAVYDNYYSGGDDDDNKLSVNLDITATAATASYISDNDGVMNVSLQMTDLLIGEDGSMTPPGSILYIDLYMPADFSGALATGQTYNVGGTAEYTLYPGQISDYSGAVYYEGTYVEHAENLDDITYGIINGGTMQISGTTDNYTIICDFTTDNGFSVKCSYSGPLSIIGLP